MFVSFLPVISPLFFPRDGYDHHDVYPSRKSCPLYHMMMYHILNILMILMTGQKPQPAMQHDQMQTIHGWNGSSSVASSGSSKMIFWSPSSSASSPLSSYCNHYLGTTFCCQIFSMNDHYNEDVISLLQDDADAPLSDKIILLGPQNYSHNDHHPDVSIITNDDQLKMMSLLGAGEEDELSSGSFTIRIFNVLRISSWFIMTLTKLLFRTMIITLMMLLSLLSSGVLIIFFISTSFQVIFFYTKMFWGNIIWCHPLFLVYTTTFCESSESCGHRIFVFHLFYSCSHVTITNFL